MGKEHRLAAVPLPQVPFKRLSTLQSIGLWNAGDVADLMYHYKISEVLFTETTGETLSWEAIRKRVKPDTYKQGNKVMFFRAGVWLATLLIPYTNEMSYFFRTLRVDTTSEVLNIGLELFAIGLNASELLDTPDEELAVKFDTARMNELRRIAFCGATMLVRSFSAHLYPVLQYTKADTHRVLAAIMGVRTEEQKYIPFEVTTYVFKEKRTGWRDFLREQ